MVIVAFAAGLPDLRRSRAAACSATRSISETRSSRTTALRRATQLTELLRTHILEAVPVAHRCEGWRQGEAHRGARCAGMRTGTRSRVPDRRQPGAPGRWPMTSKMMNDHLGADDARRRSPGSRANGPPMSPPTTRCMREILADGRHALERNRRAVPEPLPLARTLRDPSQPVPKRHSVAASGRPVLVAGRERAHGRGKKRAASASPNRYEQRTSTRVAASTYVIDWRRDQLIRSGFPPALASRIAQRRRASTSTL